MIIYIDFDGIIVDSWPVVMNEYKKEFASYEIEETKLRQLFQKMDWNFILQKSLKNEKNIEILKSINELDIRILTKINSDNEAEEKNHFLMERNIKLPIITVPIDVKKCEIVNPIGNILIDDELKNVKEWTSEGGIGILYSKNNDNKDSDGIENPGYREISQLSIQELKKFVQLT